MKGFTKVDFCCFLFSGTGVVSFGLVGLGLTAFNVVAGASMVIAAATAYYGSVATCFASVGKALPMGKPLF